MKKFLCIVSSFVLVLALVGSTAAFGYSGGSYNLKIGTYFSGQQSGGIYAQMFSDHVAKLSDGKIVIDVHQDWQLGSQSELAEAIALGTLDFCPQDWSMFDTVLGFTKGAILGFPFLFENWDHVAAFYKSDDFAKIAQELLEQHNIRYLGSSGDGFRQCYTQVPVNKAEDFKGLRLRVPDISIYIETFQALGAATVIVPGAELYTSLQSGIVNAMERPMDGMYSNNLFEQTKYLVMSNHIYVDFNLFVSETVFQKLDPEAQAVIIKAGKEASEAHFPLSRQRDLDAYNGLLTVGKQELIEIDTTELNKISEIVKKAVWPKYLGMIDGGQAIVDNIAKLAR